MARRSVRFRLIASGLAAGAILAVPPAARPANLPGGCVAVAAGRQSQCDFIATGPIGYAAATYNQWNINVRHPGDETLYPLAGSPTPGHPGSGVLPTQGGDHVYLNLGCGLPFGVGSCTQPIAAGFITATTDLTQVPGLPPAWDVHACVATMQHPVPDPRSIEVLEDWIPAIYRSVNCRFVASTGTVFYAAATPNPWQISECDGAGANCRRVAGTSNPNRPGAGSVAVTPGNVIDASIGPVPCAPPCPDRTGAIYAQSV